MCIFEPKLKPNEMNRFVRKAVFALLSLTLLGGHVNAQFTTTFAKNATPGQQDGLYYSLPQTMLQLDFVIAETTVEEGPLSDYADNYLETSKGDIYMTTNMQNKSLQQYCATDSLLKKEQNRIEKQITDFEEHIWSTPVDSVEQARRDSIAAASAKGKKAKAVTDKASSSAARSSRRSSASSGKEKSGGSSGGGNSGAPRVSVRRQRH